MRALGVRIFRQRLLGQVIGDLGNGYIAALSWFHTRESIMPNPCLQQSNVDNSTIKPAAARRIAEKLFEKNVFALDAPVSGGDVGAKNGTLTIMVGGDTSALEKAMPVFKAMGKTVT